MKAARYVATGVVLATLCWAVPSAQVGSPDLAGAIDRLGAFDYRSRTEAARTLRRANPDVVVPALEQAARSHADTYVRFRALVTLTGFLEGAAGRIMRDGLSDRNDRIRTVAYQWFEYHPDPSVLPQLIAALANERSEFVRPALSRSVAAYVDDPRARAALAPLVVRGEDMFRGAVIEALGDYRGTFALPAISEVAKLDGPLQDDAITALGKLGDRSALKVLTEVQKTASVELQPTISAAFCLLGVECARQEEYLRRTFEHAIANDDAPLLRGVVHALGALGAAGQQWAVVQLFSIGGTQADQVRSPVALGIGVLTMRRPAVVLQMCDERGARTPDLELIRDAFDMLSEEFEEERFYAELRRQFWNSPAGSTRRNTAERLLAVLEF